jgi:hypothetical protein
VLRALLQDGEVIREHRVARAGQARGEGRLARALGSGDGHRAAGYADNRGMQARHAAELEHAPQRGAEQEGVEVRRRLVGLAPGDVDLPAAVVDQELDRVPVARREVEDPTSAVPLSVPREVNAGFPLRQLRAPGSQLDVNVRRLAGRGRRNTFDRAACPETEPERDERERGRA